VGQQVVGYDFVVEYKPGPLNVVADALSRCNEEEGELGALSGPQFSLFNDIREEINGEVTLSQLRDAIRGGAKSAAWSVVDGLILFKGRVYVAPSSKTRQEILELVHGTQGLVVRGFTRLYIA
jgi:hypothetical protein